MLTSSNLPDLWAVEGMQRQDLVVGILVEIIVFFEFEMKTDATFLFFYSS